MDRLTNRMRTAKHAAWLWRRREWSRIEPAVAPAIDAGLDLYSTLFPPPSAVAAASAADPVPRRIFCLWTGDNEMSENRLRSIARIRQLNEPAVEVVLVRPDNIQDWVVPGHPLHPRYEDLALIHRSDYLRTYLMHHHGGGYSDVKAAHHPWSPCFDLVDSDDQTWILGYRELSYRMVAPAPKGVHRRLRIHHSRLIGNGAYIAKSHTPLTQAWLDEAERRLDLWSADLAKHPGDIHSGPDGYPVPFYGLLGEIFHPLCLEFHEHVAQDPRLTPGLVDYK